MNVSLPPEESSQHDLSGTHMASWWEIICTTPIGDALRGEWSARLSYKQILRTSSLPSAIVQRITQIVRKARLWRSERNDVTRELIAHFQEGLDRGVPAALLVDQFGDVKTTARLIRRAKLRKRPIWWKTWYGVSRTFVAVLAILVVVYIVQAVRFFTGKPVITRNIVKELNDHVRKIPVEDRAWPLYVEAMKDFPNWPKGLEEFVSASPKSKQWTEIVELVHQNKARIAAIQRAAEKPHLGWLWGDPNDPAFQLSEQQDERFNGVRPNIKFLETTNPSTVEVADTKQSLTMEIARLLWLDANVSASERDSQQVYLDIKATFDLSEQMFDAEDKPSIISQLVGAIFFKSTSILLLNMTAQYPDLLSADQLNGLAHRIQAFHGGKIIRYSFDAEKFFFEDLLQRTYTAGENGIICYPGWKLFIHWGPGLTENTDSLNHWNDFLGPIMMTFAVNRSQAESEYKTILNDALSEFKSRPWESTYSEQQFRSLDRGIWGLVRNPIASLTYPSVSHLTRLAEEMELQRSTILVVLGLNLFKIERGNWPDQLTELVPTYLSTIPLDPNDGRPLRYKLTESGPLVYSVGEDRYDDGGRPTLEQKERRPLSIMIFSNSERASKIHSNPKDPQNGDWILWPPVEKKSEP